MPMPIRGFILLPALLHYFTVGSRPDTPQYEENFSTGDRRRRRQRTLSCVSFGADAAAANIDLSGYRKPLLDRVKAHPSQENTGGV
jgi:hypothetical protein